MKELNFKQKHLIGLGVCSYAYGDGKIVSIDASGLYPICVTFKEVTATFTSTGKEYHKQDFTPLRVGKIENYPPQIESLPIPEKQYERFVWNGVPTKVLVSDKDDTTEPMIALIVSGVCIGSNGDTLHVVGLEEGFDTLTAFRYAWKINKE